MAKPAVGDSVFVSRKMNATLDPLAGLDTVVAVEERSFRDGRNMQFVTMLAQPTRSYRWEGWCDDMKDIGMGDD